MLVLLNSFSWREEIKNKTGSWRQADSFIFSNYKYGTIFWVLFVLGNQVALTKIIGSFSINDGNGNDNAITKNLIGRLWKNNRATRAARSYEQVRAVLF